MSTARPPYAPNPDRDPWDRQRGESGKAYEAFIAYRDRGVTRSLVGVSRALRKNVKLIENWGKRWGWAVRVNAWDRHVAEEARRAHIDEVRRMARRHAQDAQALAVLGRDQLRKVLTLAQKMKVKPLTNRHGEVDLGAIRALLVEAARLERLSVGEPESVVEQRSADPWAELLAQLDDIGKGEGDASE